MVNVIKFKRALLIVYIAMFLVSFIGIQLYKDIQVEGETIVNSSEEITAEVVLTSDNSYSSGLVRSSDVEIDKKDVNVKSLVKTNIIEKKVVVPKQVVKKVIQSDIKTEVIGEFKVSGYCKCSLCSQNKVKKDIMSDYKGINVATNSNEIPFGTKIWIDGVGIRQTQPSGQKLTQNEVKIYFPTHEEVVNFGTQTIEILKIVD